MALTLNDFKRIKPKNQAAIILAIAGGGLALFWYAVLMPIQQDNALQQSTLDQLNQQVAVASQRASQLAEIRREAEALEGRLGALRDILPTERETAEIMAAVRTAAEEVSMTIVSVAPQAVVEREVWSEWPWAFQVESTYHNMALFLDRIRTIPRIVNVSGVVLTGQGDGVTRSVGVNFTATTFVYREVDELTRGAAN
jgi:type IV pilus assembly protein PilO